MAKTHGGDRQRYWREAIGRQQASGLSIVGFCAREGLSLASFHAWKRRLLQTRRKTERKAAKQVLVPVHFVGDPAEGRGNLEIEWPGGVVLRVQGGDERTIGTVIAARSDSTARRAKRC
jgi:hypothetical protein